MLKIYQVLNVIHDYCGCVISKRYRYTDANFPVNWARYNKTEMNSNRNTSIYSHMDKVGLFS